MESPVSGLISQLALYNIAESMIKRVRPRPSRQHHTQVVAPPDDALPFDPMPHRRFPDQPPAQSSSGRVRHDHPPPSPSPLNRRKSSGSASTSTAVTAPSTFDDLAVPFIHAPSLRRRHHDPEPHDIPRKDKGKAVAAPSLRSRRYLPIEEEDPEVHRDKCTDKQAYSGPFAHAELERMRKEIELLKKSAQESRKTVKKQAKEIKELKSRLQGESVLKANHELEIKTLKEKSGKNEELITVFEHSLQCQICMDLLHRPYSLSPCGHILCLQCLQSWFRTAPPPANDSDADDSDDPYYLLTRQKSCPCCRGAVKRRPAPVFLVKSVVNALVHARDGGDGAMRSPSPGVDPWKGLFRGSDDERLGRESDDDDNDDDDDDDDDDLLDESDSDGDLGIGWPSSAVRWSFNERGRRFALGYVTSSPSESEYGGEEDFDEDEDEDEESADEPTQNADPEEGRTWDREASPVVYVRRRWQPPTVSINVADYEGCFPERSEEEGEMILMMLRRGCTYDMIQTYYMEYSHARGLVAQLRSLEEPYIDSDEETNRVVEGWGFHHLCLGWNIRLEEEDRTGEVYVERLLKAMKENPREWECHEKPGERGVYEVMRLVRDGEEGTEEYDTTDTEVWLDANENYAL